MSIRQPPLRHVIGRLIDERLVDQDLPSVAAYLGEASAAQPWYIRTMVGFGAWLASLLLIGFVVRMGMASGGGYSVFGLLFLGGAIYLRKASDSDFSVQSALAAGLAGQALIVIGVMEMIDWDEPELGLGLVTAINLVLFVIFPDRVYRVLSVLLAVGSLVVLFYVREWNALVPFIGPLLTAGLITVTLPGFKLFSGRNAVYLRPLQSGLMLSAFGCLLVSTFYVLPEVGGLFQFYPRPWISTVMLGAMLVYLLSVTWQELLSTLSAVLRILVFSIVIVVVATTWLAPGLTLSLIVLLLGAHAAHRSMMGAGIAFLAVFLGAYFYGIQLTMLQKSLTLVTAGIAVLLARWALLRVIPGGAGND